MDDTETVLLTEQMMLRASYDLEIARNGEEALEKLATYPADLVLLDVMMPKMNGIETCRAIRANPDTATVPIVMVTTLGQEATVNEAFEAGCTAFVTKPFTRQSLVSKIRECLD